MHSPSLGARAFIPVVLAGALLLGLAPVPKVAAAAPTEAQQIIAIAKTKLGDPWRYGASGPSAFDCSGLVQYAFRAAGDLAAIDNGRLRSAQAIYYWFRSHGKADRSNPQPGDLVIWGGGTHIGIYIGYGKAISTLTTGVTIHGVFAVRAPFTAYLHTGMSRTGGDTMSAPTITTTATVTRTVRYAAYLRTGPGTRYARIALLAVGTRLAVRASRKDSLGRTWFNVRAGTRLGWVASWLTR